MKRKGRRKKNSSFKPTSDYIEEQTKKFLEKGGIIKKSQLSDQINLEGESLEADEFLSGK